MIQPQEMFDHLANMIGDRTLALKATQRRFPDFAKLTPIIAPIDSPKIGRPISGDHESAWTVFCTPRIAGPAQSTAPRASPYRRATHSQPAHHTTGASMNDKVHLLELRERTSANGNRYLSGWLGKAGVVVFLDCEAEEPTWQVYVSTPAPRAADPAATVRDPKGSSRHRVRRPPNPGATTTTDRRQRLTTDVTPHVTRGEII